MNMTKQQKNFKGKAFIAKPDKIQFKDFTVGKAHYLIITLTNVSNAFNSFNVLPLPPKIRVIFMLKFRIILKLNIHLKEKYLLV